MKENQDDGIVKLSNILSERRDEYTKQLAEARERYPLVGLVIAVMEAALVEVESRAVLARKLGSAQLIDPEYAKEVEYAKRFFECLKDGGTWDDSGRCVQKWIERPSCDD